MFDTCTTRQGQPALGAGQTPLHEYYAYLRLFFGRFLANVRVRPNHGAADFEWLIPGGQGPTPPPERIGKELTALGWMIERAQAELHADGAGAGLLRQTMAARALSAVQVPSTAEDVRFNQAGDLVVINWCADRQGPQRRLAACRPRQLVAQLAEALQVPPPSWEPVPAPMPAAKPKSKPSPARQEWPQTHVWRGAAARPSRRRARAKTVLLWIGGAVLLGLLAGAIAGGVMRRIAARAPQTPPPPAPSQTPPSGPSEPAFEGLPQQLSFAGARAVVLYDIGDGVADEGDCITVWLPVAAESDLERKAFELGTLQARAVGGAPLSERTRPRWWLVQSRVARSPNHKRLYDRISFPGNARRAPKLWRSPHTLILSAPSPAGMASPSGPAAGKIVSYDTNTTN